MADPSLQDLAALLSGTNPQGQAAPTLSPLENIANLTPEPPTTDRLQEEVTGSQTPGRDLPDEDTIAKANQAIDPAPVVSFGGVPRGGSISQGQTDAKQAYRKTAYKEMGGKKNPIADYEEASARAKADANKRFTPYQQAIADNTRNQLVAAELLNNAQIKQSAELSKHKLEMAKWNQDQADAEQAALMTAQARSEEARNSYRAALLDYGATTVNPGAMFNRASKVDQFGMLAAVFVHDMLGAKGIKTSAMDSLNAGIQRNIDAQILAIQTKGQVAAGFKQLWDMQRAESSSDAEARERIRGFALKAAELKIEGEMGRYDSKLAQAKIAAAKALIQKEQIANDLEVNKYINQAAAEDAKNGLEMITSTQRVAAQNYATSANYRLGMAQIDAAKLAKDPKELDNRYLVDSTQSGYGKVIRAFKWKDEKTNQAIQEKERDQANFLKSSRDLLALGKEVGTLPPDFWSLSRFADDRQRMLLRLSNYTGRMMAYAQSGKQITKQELEFFQGLTKPEQWLTNGDAMKTLAAISARVNRERRALIDTETVPLRPDRDAAVIDARTGTGIQIPTTASGLAEETEFDLRANPPQEQATKFDRSVSALARPDRDSPVSVGFAAEMANANFRPTEAWKAYARQNWDASLEGLGYTTNRPPAAFVALGGMIDQAKEVGRDGQPTQAAVAARTKLAELTDESNLFQPVQLGRFGDAPEDPNSPRIKAYRDFVKFLNTYTPSEE